MHPASPLLDLARFGPQAAIPLLITFGRRPGLAVPIVVVGVVVLLVARYLVWSRFTYGVDGSSMVVESGVLNRSRRVVPLDRVQQVDLQRKLRHRALGLVVVRIDTAGGGSGPEVALDAVTDVEAERLRRVLAARRTPAVAAAAGAGGAEHPTEAGSHLGPGPGLAPELDEREVVTLSAPRLAMAGVSGSKLLVVFAVLGSLFGLLDDTLGDVGQNAADSALDGARPALSTVLVVVLLGIPVWLAAAAGAAILTDGGFRLTRRGDLLHVRRGLLDQREASLAIHRVQVVRIAQNPLRRMLGVVSVTLQSAGGSGEVEQQDSRITVPLLDRVALDALLAEVLPDAPGLPALHPAPPAARRRAWVRRLVPALAVAVPVAVLFAPLGLAALLLVVVAALDAELAYRGLGWATVDDHVVARRGGLSRETALVPVAKVQSTRLVSSPFQRRSGLATLLVDVAGRGRTPALVDGEASAMTGLRHGALAAGAARRDEAAVRRRVAAGATGDTTASAQGLARRADPPGASW
ncbi:PH domain-containing protein [Iamia sp.]|uniref:PH domain-containing protein n=1 Tax=Iamia sp. TaxID=2722710 RepID=UPI002B6DD8AC|nr:PH domain-containing protein [Iamia sp.]HXH58680.1 PH domain-containing protein [Iamia sp.]